MLLSKTIVILFFYMSLIIGNSTIKIVGIINNYYFLIDLAYH